MSLPFTLNPSDQALVNSIEAAITTLRNAIANAATTSGASPSVLRKIIVDNFGVADTTVRVEELSRVFYRRTILRAIAAKLTPEERTAVGLDQLN